MSYNYPPPPQYPYPPTPVRQTSTTATISVIAGILGWTLLPGVGSIIAVITGHMAKSEINHSGGMIGGGGAATWGLILGYSAIVLGLVSGCCALAFFVVLPILGISLGALGNNILMPLLLFR